MDWRKDLQDYWLRQDEKKEPIYLIEVEYRVSKFLSQLIDEIPESGVMITEEQPYAKKTSYLSDLKQQLRERWLK
jgi:hypothetical protein